MQQEIQIWRWTLCAQLGHPIGQHVTGVDPIHSSTDAEQDFHHPSDIDGTALLGLPFILDLRPQALRVNDYEQWDPLPFRQPSTDAPTVGTISRDLCYCCLRVLSNLSRVTTRVQLCILGGNGG